MKRRWTWIRWTNVALALLLAILLLTYGSRLYRECRFTLTGTARADGLTIYLDPKDQIITYSILRYGEWETGESAEMRRLIRSGDTVIDVGANVGWYTLLASSLVGPSGQVLSFEPAPPSLELLRKSIAENRISNVTVEPKAVSDHHGKVTLHVHEWNRGGHSLLDGPDRAATVEVESVSLDEYLRGRESEIGLIKVDVEGAEGFVLAGMAGILRKRLARTLVVEFNPTSVRRTGLEPEGVLRRVLASGYRVRTLDVWSGRTTAMDEAAALELSRRMEAEGKWTDLVFEREGGDGR